MHQQSNRNFTSMPVQVRELPLMQVLIIEHDAVLADGLERYLQQVGYGPEVVANRAGTVSSVWLLYARDGLRPA